MSTTASAGTHTTDGRLTGQLDVHRHVRSQRHTGVVHLEADLERAGGSVVLREGVADARRHGGALPAGQRHRDGRSRAEVLRVPLEEVHDHPHPCQIGDAVQLFAPLQPLRRKDVAREDVSGCRRPQLDVACQFAGLAELEELRLAHAEVAQAVHGGAQLGVGREQLFIGFLAVGGHPFERVERVVVGLLRRQEVGAVEGEEDLLLADEGPDG